MPNINCDLCEAEGAVLMQSNLGDGSTIAVGGNCLIGYALGLAAGFTEGIPADVALAHMDGLHKLLTNMAPELIPAGPEDAPKKGPRKRKAATADVSRETSDAADPAADYEDGNTDYGKDDADELLKLIDGVAAD